MAFSICYWANYTQGKMKLSRKSEKAIADDLFLKFLYDADLRHHITSHGENGCRPSGLWIREI